MSLMELGDLRDPHQVGNPECPECWSGFPKPCDCGGLVHASFQEESWDGYSLYERCDKCGESP